jgi:hypothetical protein
MPQYDDTNRGVLFPEREKKGEKHPDYTGKIDVNGQVYRLAAWIKSKGVLSLSVSEFKAERDAPDPRTAAQPQHSDLGDEIPW